MKKHYRDSYLLKIINIIIEYLIILCSYLFGGYIGFHINFGFAVMCSAFIVLIFVLLGDYQSIHFRSLKREMVQTFLVFVFCAIMGSSALFWINGGQVSRTWLAISIVVAFLAITVKRILFSKIATKYFNSKLESYKMIMVGSGKFAKRFYNGISKDANSRYELLGYFGKSENVSLDKYLGKFEDMPYFIEHNDISAIVIADEDADRELYIQVLNLCMIYKLEAYAVPVFNDFMVGMQSRELADAFNYGGLHLIPIDVKHTDNILGVNIAVTNMEKTISDITDNIDKWKGEYICVSNVHTTVMAHDNPEYRAVQNGAILALPDGGPLSSYSRNMGNLEATRVTGPDLMKELLTRSKELNYRHFFYGSKPETLEKLREAINEKYPDAIIAGMISPPFRQLTEEEDRAYIEEINATKPDFVWVGLGAPKQEYWMAAHKGKINAIMLGVGAAFDYEVGNIDRAPMWMQKSNLEWLYRLMQDPKRLFKRYFVTNLKYIWLTRR